jgi:transcriptional regulator with XRE-family HTH domain
MSMGSIDSRRAAFNAWVQAHGPTVADVARRAQVPQTTLYSYASGKSQSLKGITQEKIASAYRVSVEALFGDAARAQPEIGVWGKIGARAEIYPLADYTSDPMYQVQLPATLDSEEEYVAFEIEGYSMPPAEPGWLVVFRKIEVTPEDLLNAPCLVDTKDGQRLFKRLRKGYTPGRYNLESWDGSPIIEDVEVVSVLPFAALTPGRRGR